MLSPRNLASFESDHRLEPSSRASGPPSPRSFATRHSSTASGVSLGRRIQKHLDAGKPLYIGFDPAYPPRDSTDVSGTYEDSGELGDGFGKRVNRHKKWLRVLTLGAPLDIAAKLILTVGMAMALMALLWATNRLIQNGRLNKDFNLVFIVGQCIWGVFFGASCIFGMELMWGRWRRSPSVALIFTASWVLVSLILLVSSVVWIYFYLTSRAAQIERCLGKTVKVTITRDKDSLHHMAPQAQINNCLGKVGSKVNWALVWGIIHALFSYSGMIVVVWGRDYRRRLLEIRRCEKAKKRPKNRKNDKVGLLLGTTPLGRLSSHRVAIQRENSTEVGQGAEGSARTSWTDVVSQTAEPVEQQENAGIIIRITGPSQPYATQGNTQIPQGERVGSTVSSISSVSSTGLGIAVDGQSFMDI